MLVRQSKPQTPAGWEDRVQVLSRFKLKCRSSRGSTDRGKSGAHRDSREYMRRMLGVHTMPCRSGCPEAPCTADVGASPSRVYNAFVSSCNRNTSFADESDNQFDVAGQSTAV